MPIVAITGNLCSGKTTVLNMLRQKGVKIFDADTVVHSLYTDKDSRVYRDIARTFPEALTPQENISRRKLQETVCTDSDALSVLERIVHPAVIREMKKWIHASRKENVAAAAEVPLLFEKKLQKVFDAVIIVKSRDSIVLNRICKRFQIPRGEALKKLNFARRRRQKKYPGQFVIVNNAGKRELTIRVNRIWRLIINKDNV